MRILIAGAGGVGCYFGGLLAKGKLDVSFLARGENLRVLQKNGLTFKGVNQNFQIPVNAFEKIPEKEKPFDLVLVCVKAHQTQSILCQFQGHVQKETLIISLQNGMRQHLLLQEVFGKGRVGGGFANLGAYMEAPGVLRHLAAGKMVVGELEAAISDRIRCLEKSFQKAGVDLEVTDEITKRQWQKLVWNVGFNGPTALIGLPVGEILKRPEQRVLIEELMVETLGVAKKSGILLKDTLPQEMIQHSERELKPVISSMLHDRKSKRPLEWNIFYGFISEEGKRLGLPTPASDFVGGVLSAISPSDGALA